MTKIPKKCNWYESVKIVRKVNEQCKKDTHQVVYIISNTWMHYTICSKVDIQACKKNKGNNIHPVIISRLYLRYNDRLTIASTMNTFFFSESWIHSLSLSLLVSRFLLLAAHSRHSVKFTKLIRHKYEIVFVLRTHTWFSKWAY